MNNKIDMIITENLNLFVKSLINEDDNVDGYQEARLIEKMKELFIESFDVLDISIDAREYDGPDYEYKGVRFIVNLNEIESDTYYDKIEYGSSSYDEPQGGNLMNGEETRVVSATIWFDSEEYGDGEFEADDKMLEMINDHCDFDSHNRAHALEYDEYMDNNGFEE